MCNEHVILIGHWRYYSRKDGWVVGTIQKDKGKRLVGSAFLKQKKIGFGRMFLKEIIKTNHVQLKSRVSC